MILCCDESYEIYVECERMETDNEVRNRLLKKREKERAEYLRLKEKFGKEG